MIVLLGRTTISLPKPLLCRVLKAYSVCCLLSIAEEELSVM